MEVEGISVHVRAPGTRGKEEISDKFFSAGLTTLIQSRYLPSAALKTTVSLNNKKVFRRFVLSCDQQTVPPWCCVMGIECYNTIHSHSQW